MKCCGSGANRVLLSATRLPTTTTAAGAALFLASSAARRHPTDKTWVSAPPVSI